MAVTEDLMGGVDVTSTATVPADQRSMGTFASRGDGVVAGLAVAAAAIDAVCGDAASRSSTSSPTATAWLPVTTSPGSPRRPAPC